MSTSVREQAQIDQLASSLDPDGPNGALQRAVLHHQCEIEARDAVLYLTAAINRPHERKQL